MVGVTWGGVTDLSLMMGDATMFQIIQMTMQVAREHGNLWNNHHNQLLRAVGKYTTIYNGGTRGGTVRDRDGKCWDWWPTEEILSSVFTKIRIVPAT